MTTFILQSFPDSAANSGRLSGTTRSTSNVGKCRAKSTPFDIYVVQGKRVLDHAIFRGVIEIVSDFLAMPAGFLNLAQDVVLSEDILRALFEKLDSELLSDGVSTVREGFQAFIAAHWHRSFCDDQYTATWLLALFRPLLKEIQRCFIESVPLNRSNDLAQKFLQNLQKIQTLPSDTVDSSADSFSSTSSSKHHLAPPPAAGLAPRMFVPSEFLRLDLSLELFWPDIPELTSIEMELNDLENQKLDLSLAARQEDAALLPAFEMKDTSAPLAGVANSSAAPGSERQAEEAQTKMLYTTDFTNSPADGYDAQFDHSDPDTMGLFLNVEMFQAQSSSSAARFGSLAVPGGSDLRRPLTPPNTAYPTSPANKGKGRAHS
ncbi:hypothetical protein B0H16DRAFT_1737497 [Mycena metata]|uniref:Uncharacterized protein n=1 Tax=Mycena metata TaxID=1033252 RepID=A0AAD7MLF4_9AGAR|nr:hypothetical protein B0H16DRAFT_1737497 [Mycena metata]